MASDLICYVHSGGVIEINSQGSVAYTGGTTIKIQLCRTLSHSEFINQISQKFNLHRKSYTFHYTAAAGSMNMTPLMDESSMEMMLNCNGSTVHVYVMVCASEECGGGSVGQRNMRLLIDGRAECTEAQSIGFSHRCAELPMRELEARRFDDIIAGSGHTFKSADEFRDAVYLMSVAGRFKYGFKRNYPKHMSVYCKVEGCKWKITCRAIGDSSVVRIYTFHNVHEHSIEDIVMSQPDVKPKHAAALVDSIIQSTPEYTPRQLCKDFLMQHAMHLTYKQAWKLKEKAKERIYGNPKNYYKLLPWMCDLIKESNPATIIKLTHSCSGHFHQLFIAHGVSIEDFTNGCRPLIALDSCHLSGPYGGALLAASAYDANDSLFTVAFGIVSPKNYDDWLWFLKNLKVVVGEREVVFISDRHLALVRAVPEIFGAENHSYCFRHLKENFSAFMSRHSKRGQNKDDALDFLNSIAYARLEADYVRSLDGLRQFNKDYAAWVESNNPNRWAMLKYPKKRWDKITTNLAESFNSWLRVEWHNDISTLLIQHMIKMGNMLASRKKNVKKWDGQIGPRIKSILRLNLVKGETYRMYRFLNDTFGVQVGPALVNVDMRKHTCMCKGWDMSGIPCEHACAVILFSKQQPCEFVDVWYKAEKQELIYRGHFSCIETHDMPRVLNDSVVVNAAGEKRFSLLPPLVKKPPGRPKKKRDESQFMDKRPIHCQRCMQTGHNRRICKNPLPENQ